MVKVVPLPIMLFTESPPLCCSMMRCAIASPSPVPRLLVVKNGLKIVSRLALSIPDPESLMVMVKLCCFGAQKSFP